MSEFPGATANGAPPADTNEANPQRPDLEKSARKAKPEIAPALLTLEQAANYLAASRSTVRRLVIAGEIPAVPLRPKAKNKSYRIRQAELDRWILAAERQHTRQVKE